MMDVSLAAAFVSSQAAQLQLAVAAKMMKMNADAEKGIVQLINAAQQNLASLAEGVGANLDISV
jgi:hypothetical protein